MKNKFRELSENELLETNGGLLLTSTIMTVAGVKITGLMCVKAGITFGIAAGTAINLKK